jgi:hypothetical protein
LQLRAAEEIFARDGYEKAELGEIAHALQGAPKEPFTLNSRARKTCFLRCMKRTFHTENGRDIMLTSSTGTNPPSFSSGQQVDVLYLPSQPEGTVINSFGQLWLDPVILAGLGAGFACIPAVAWLFVRDRQEPSPASSDWPASLRANHWCRPGRQHRGEWPSAMDHYGAMAGSYDTKSLRIQKCAHLVRPKRLGTRREISRRLDPSRQPLRLRDGY